MELKEDGLQLAWPSRLLVSYICCKIDWFAKQLCGLVSRTMMYYIHSPLKRNVMSNIPRKRKKKKDENDKNG